MKQKIRLGNVDIIITGGPYQVRPFSDFSAKTRKRVEAAGKKFFGKDWKPKSV
jgi:hypothetical protein